MPKAVKKHFTFNTLQANLTGKGSVLIKGASEACSKTDKWSGDGNISVELGVGSKAKAAIPKFIVQGEAKAETNVNETLTVPVGSSQLRIYGQWGGLTLNGAVTVQSRGLTIKPFKITPLKILNGGKTPTKEIDLPNL